MSNEITDETSDGYHTFNELYDHKRALFAALCKVFKGMSWKTKNHHPDDDEMFEGHFLVGIDFPSGPVLYHFELEHWDAFSLIQEIDHAPKWDKSTPQDTVKRLLDWANL